MESKMRSIGILAFGFGLYLVLQGCGSSSGTSAPAPSPSESVPVSKTISLEADLPADMKSMQNAIQWQASLKGSSSEGKALGAMGPVTAERDGNRYQFIFTLPSKDLENSALLSVDLVNPIADLSSDCQRVASLSKNISLLQEGSSLTVAAADFDSTPDCDGDGLSNLKEFLEGTKVDSKDSDGDGVDDFHDLYPLDAKESADQDGDAVGDNADNCPSIQNADQKDFEQDKIGDVCDPDIDNDGMSNALETQLGLNVYNADTDGDGVNDSLDAFPKDLRFSSDRDGDGIADPLDNCPDASNTSQVDLDNDLIGDVCDADTDGDGLSNAEELVVGSDAVVTNPLLRDTDADGKIDGSDNCPATANANQKDTDGDLFGDSCDCNISNASTHPNALDDPDSGYVDSNCDGIDGDKTKAVFVSGTRGNEQNSGNYTAPVQSLATGMALAKAAGKDLYVGAGNYAVNAVTFLPGLRFYGGYQTENLANGAFTKRDVTTSDPQIATFLVSSGSDVTLKLENISSEILFDGFRISNDKLESDPEIGSRTILIKNSKAKFTNDTIQGGTHANGTRTTGVAIEGNSTVTLHTNWIDAGSGQDASTGVWISTADNVTLQNNVIRGGNGRFAIGVDVTGASPTLTSNTIDATSHFAALTVATTEVLRFENALTLKSSNNILITGSSANQYGMFCLGLEPAAANITNNLFASFSGTTPVRSVSCLGDFDLVAANGLLLGTGSATGNKDYDKTTLSQLINTTTYKVVDSRYLTMGASR